MTSVQVWVNMVAGRRPDWAQLHPAMDLAVPRPNYDCVVGLDRGVGRSGSIEAQLPPLKPSDSMTLLADL